MNYRIVSSFPIGISSESEFSGLDLLTRKYQVQDCRLCESHLRISVRQEQLLATISAVITPTF